MLLSIVTLPNAYADAFDLSATSGEDEDPANAGKGILRMPPRNPFVIEADYTDGVLSAPSLVSDDATAAIVVTDAATGAITFSAEVPAISLGSGIYVGVYSNFHVTITLSSGASFSGSYGL